MSSIIFLAPLTPSIVSAEMYTSPSSVISILAPVSSIILLITFPPEPITSLILSGSILIVAIFGAYSDNSALGASIADLITSSIWNLAALACSRAVFIISSSIP